MHVEFNWQTLMRKQFCFNHNPLPYTFAIYKNEIQNKRKVMSLVTTKQAIKHLALSRLSPLQQRLQRRELLACQMVYSLQLVCLDVTRLLSCSLISRIFFLCHSEPYSLTSHVLCICAIKFIYKFLSTSTFKFVITIFATQRQ